MADMQVTYAQLAQVALSTMAGASVPADDRTLALVQGTRQFLRQIADGTLAIVEANPQQAVGQPATTAAPHKPHNRSRPGPAKAANGVVPAQPPTKGNGMRGADGIVPESITGAPGREH